MFAIIPTYTESNWLLFSCHFDIVAVPYLTYKCDQWFIIDERHTKLKCVNTVGTAAFFQVMDREIV